jgi:hypothetical protein
VATAFELDASGLAGLAFANATFIPPAASTGSFAVAMGSIDGWATRFTPSFAC